ncbi:CorA family metal ion transporter [Venustampulla echinocandica]|uniref:CorA family metal ion transporter n=1 Tax=Venustampulla echinocandica TaxID=2656787 RepID=A0A370T8Y0_9HELO|nr:CorA family metal ion transporter [Venustampulla echinocandica]RDL29937.1 CorA family metal ion transporter [Venustampulla echinocandica]
MSAQPPPPSSTSMAPSNPGNSEHSPQRPEPAPLPSQENAGTSSATLRPVAAGPQAITKKKRNHRGGKKKRARRPSFGASTEDGSGMPELPRSRLEQDPSNAARSRFYRLQDNNLSNTSVESEGLLDHREQQSMRPRRPSTMTQSAFGVPQYDSPSSYRPQYQNPFRSSESVGRRPKSSRNELEQEEAIAEDEREPLIPPSSKPVGSVPTYGTGDSTRRRRPSSRSSSNSKRKTVFDRPSALFPQFEEYHVNHPPSIPGSPPANSFDREMSFGDVMARDDFASPRASSRNVRDDTREHGPERSPSPKGMPRRDGGYERRHTIALQAEEDVCFPIEDLSEMAEDEMAQRVGDAYAQGPGMRRRRSKWPDLDILNEWSRFEKEGRSEERRAKKITEPHLVGGRLRPTYRGWHRAEDDAPYRFTYFNEEFKSTIHGQAISELVPLGGSFRELFIPDPPVLSDSSDSEGEDLGFRHTNSQMRHVSGMDGDSHSGTARGSMESLKLGHSGNPTTTPTDSKRRSHEDTPNGNSKAPSPAPEKPTRYGDRPTWWLDVLSPTEAEMKVISKAFGIHPLTAEDIMVQEAREKVELFRNYYFVNYRSFEQDMNNDNFLEPVNMYVVVFREGIISFHFSLTPHPANVRRRVRQLKDYLVLSSDWISYAIIDDITDAFAPLIQTIEDEVDDIDDAILRLHSANPDGNPLKINEKQSEYGDGTSGESGGDMLRRVGDCRKKVMGLYRLLGNKADVIRGFAKRCNEHWEVAPRSEIGLYLGDIQDHIITMTGNLSHYEKILARAHGNYLAQINIRMNERQEQTADVLGRLTVLGTIVLPMNIITGLWGMNVWVPGQEEESDLTWFWCLTAGLLLFGFSCFFVAKMVYRIV